MVNIEIDGIPLKVDESRMIIQAADEAGIDIPRFCYHKKLSIAANCRMCLVEVDKSRKALPACATPVTEGMKVFTQSKVALAAQRGVMEFLLINHPLDCPICDQAGECELQDLSLGYGKGISRFSEKKRVVKDKDIGPLIQTEMTRCIHCTRCVRFGTEIAGIKELGATGRGEHMEIGTYVEHSLASELSGNIIDLCPVGALTSKPFRYKARAWEMQSFASVAPHDAVGSALELHVRGNEVMRVVPKDNESVNETWISDRDRFSYLGLRHADRAAKPMIKHQGVWQETDWQTALSFAIDGLDAVQTKHGDSAVAGLMSPTATLEEGHLFQKWLRARGVDAIDHRLRLQSVDDAQAAYWSTSMTLPEIESSDAILVIGSNIRSEAPIVAHRIRQAALQGALVSEVGFQKRDLLMPVQHQVLLAPKQLVALLAGIARTLLQNDDQVTSGWQQWLVDVQPNSTQQNIAMQLANATQPQLIVGAVANQHPQAATIRALAQLICELSQATLLILPDANSRGLTLAGVCPDTPAITPASLWQRQRRGYVLFDVEPAYDGSDPSALCDALQQASFNVAINRFWSDAIRDYADVMLPLASFAETAGTFVGLDGRWQSFNGAVSPFGEARPGWKILRVLANLNALTGFDYVAPTEVRDELKQKIATSEQKFSSFLPDEPVPDSTDENTLQLISEVGMYCGDSLQRRSEPLQKTPESRLNRIVRIHPETATKLGLAEASEVLIRQGEKQVEAPFMLDKTIAPGCVYLAAATELSQQLGSAFGLVSLHALEALVDA
ncbi:NADH-ubiquinone oxidoreductase chain G [Methylophaga frappieri]|uniref:NADH-quinone oxidoreductase subunit G n=1 Tax=Methylophaga frappieri (strain ATCC BAA-2434 / DSM 25690 / JAM7) TaxID=754477 RepID=I1YHG3_METFJ|nr:NADH-quinone oxidoreductase subunit NuoG [Methylophaga frappieri]AFJ02356.1 NADH-ubiquinone oxidoreductase chain G [Methylophaga frappieri]